MGLKVFMTLAELGDKGLGAITDHQARMARTLKELLLARGWTILNRSPLPLVCFSHDAFQSAHDVEGAVRRIVDRGKVWLSQIRLGEDQAAFRVCLTNYRTTVEDLEALLDELEIEITGRSAP